MRDHSYHRETGVRELVAGDNSLFVAGFAGAEICSGYSAPLRRGLFIMRIERAEGDKDPVRSLSPIHPLCLARSIFLRLSLSLSSLPFPRQYHRFFETDVLTYTPYTSLCEYSFFFWIHTFFWWVSRNRGRITKQQGGLNAAIFQGGWRRGGRRVYYFIVSEFPLVTGHVARIVRS